MSTGYGIIPLGVFSDDASWLTGMGFELPVEWKQSRMPTIEDIRVSLSTWVECDYQEQIHKEDLTIWAAKHGSDDRTIIYISGRRLQRSIGNHTDWLRFSGNASWIVEVIKRLAERCGPFLLTDSGGAMTVVALDTSSDVAWVDLPRSK